MPKALMTILVPIALGITAFIAADAAQPPDKGNKSGTSFSIYIEMAAGDPDVTIAESGPLEVFARCVTGSGGAALTFLLYTSSVDDWLLSAPAGATDTLLLSGVEVGTGDGDLDPRMNGVAHNSVFAVAPTGDYLGFTGVLGDHMGADCFVAGRIDIAQAP